MSMRVSAPNQDAAQILRAVALEEGLQTDASELVRIPPRKAALILDLFGTKEVVQR